MARLRLFAAAREAAGVAEDRIDASDLDALLREASQRYPKAFADLLPHCTVMVSGQAVARVHARKTKLSRDDEVALLPPVSGGEGRKSAALIVNPAARAVSARLMRVIENALSADLDLEVMQTHGPGHANELADKAASSGRDLVITLGGDGTINEVANGLVHTTTALAPLPGGMANVFCRSLGTSADMVEATGSLLNALREFSTRNINLGKADDRYFLLSCGAGLDAATVLRTKQNPAATRRYRDWYFLWSALAAYGREYRRAAPFIHLSTEATTEEVITAVVSNTRAYTFFRNSRLILSPKARLDAGLDVFALRRIPASFLPRIFTGVMKTGKHVESAHTLYEHDLAQLTLKSSSRPFPVQMDGEYLGERTELHIELSKSALAVLET